MEEYGLTWIWFWPDPYPIYTTFLAQQFLRVASGSWMEHLCLLTNPGEFHRVALVHREITPVSLNIEISLLFHLSLYLFVRYQSPVPLASFHKEQTICLSCSSFLKACIEEFVATYDETLPGWNGADLLNRVASNATKKGGKEWLEESEHLQVLEPIAFFPLSRHNIIRYRSFVYLCVEDKTHTVRPLGLSCWSSWCEYHQRYMLCTMIILRHELSSKAFHEINSNLQLI